MGTPIVNLDALIDTRVSANLDVQTTLEAKQDALDAVVDAQAILDSVDTTVSAKKIELNQHTAVKKTELDTYVDSLESGLDVYGDGKVDEYDANALNRVTQYNDNHTDKLTIYNSNDAIKMSQYNANHIDRLEDINYAYADRIVQMLKTKRIYGMIDQYIAQTEVHMIPFLSTDDANYIYYGNGTLLELGVDYTIYDTTTIELVVKTNPYDVITQINTAVLRDMLTAEGVVFEERIGAANGVAGLDENGLVPSAQLPSYVDDVLEYATYADLPVIGEAGKIYIVIADETSNGDTSSYRWTGTVYAMVSNTLNASDVKALYEANPDTNSYTDAEKNRVDINTALTTTAHTLPTAVNELDSRVAAIEDNTTLAEYGITDAYTKTEVQTVLPKVGLDLTNVVAPSAGQLAWNIEEQTIDVGLNGATLQMGQELLIRVRNNSGSTISDGTAVMAIGTIGNSGRIVVDRANLTNSNAKMILGIVTESIADGADGFCTTFGKVRGIDTRGTAYGETWLDGDILYVKDSGNGALTNIEPLKTEVKLPIAIVIKAHSNGTMFVRVISIDENATLAEINKIEEW